MAPHHKGRAQGGAHSSLREALLPGWALITAVLPLNILYKWPQDGSSCLVPRPRAPLLSEHGWGDAMGSRAPSTAFPCKEAPNSFQGRLALGSSKGKVCRSPGAAEVLDGLGRDAQTPVILSCCSDSWGAMGSTHPCHSRFLQAQSPSHPVSLLH